MSLLQNLTSIPEIENGPHLCDEHHYISMTQFVLFFGAK